MKPFGKYNCRGRQEHRQHESVKDFLLRGGKIIKVTTEKIKVLAFPARPKGKAMSSADSGCFRVPKYGGY